ncbi:hypothetical protein TNCV_3219521 [Trichonephila clavipes]|nr:hypothetical protein TNCV_3219521 [Trichonephila clavipes]
MGSLGHQSLPPTDLVQVYEEMASLESLKKKFSLQEALDLLQNLPSEISDVLTDDFSDEEVPANNLLGLSSDS